MREPLLIECLEYQRREWLSALHESDQPQAPEPKQEETNSATEVQENDKNVII